MQYGGKEKCRSVFLLKAVFIFFDGYMYGLEKKRQKANPVKSNDVSFSYVKAVRFL